MLKNLLSNAFKFTERGRVTLIMKPVVDGWNRDIETLNRADTVIAFSVQDTGIGIAPEKQKIIFEAFQQADGTTSRKYGGTGLGLSISREIARLLGGEIRVRSEMGQGSTFTLYVPRNYEAVPTVAMPQRRIEVIDLTRAAAAAALVPLDEPRQDNLIMARLDDREHITPDDRVLLVVEDDVAFAKILLDAGRQAEFKVVVAPTGDHALSLVRRYRPAAITLDLTLPDMDGWAVLDRLKHDETTRHIPTSIISVEEARGRALRMGAYDFVLKPTDLGALSTAIRHLGDFAGEERRRLLLVEDDERQRASLLELIGPEDFEVTAVGTGAEALDMVGREHFSCMVLDLGLPDMNGIELLQKLKRSQEHRNLPIIVYTGRDLSRKEESQLKRLAETIIVKDVKSPERLLDEVSLFLHRRHEQMPAAQRQMLEKLHQSVPALAGKTVLVVDDDVRNIFAISSALERYQANVLFAESGKDGLAILDQQPVDAVLMDIMMPEMDGYEVIQRIRQDPRFADLPIIAVTAKAMSADREKCIMAGANDYVAKPVDLAHLLSLLRIRLAR